MPDLPDAQTLLSFDRPGPWPFIHTVDGTMILGEVLEVGILHFKARVLEPFKVSFERWSSPRWMAGMAGATFIREHQATPRLMGKLHSEVEKAFNEWQRRKNDEETLLANMDTLEPMIQAAYRKAANYCLELDSLMQCLQGLGESVQREMRYERLELRKQFKERWLKQKEFQARLKDLRKKGPDSELGWIVLNEARDTHARFNTLQGLLWETQEAFTRQTGLDLIETYRLMGFPGLFIPPHKAWDPVDALVNLSSEVRLLLRAFP